MMMRLRSPFPYPGGKGKNEPLETAWAAMGADVPTYIEATGGSLAMLLGRPGGPGKYEMANDSNGLLVNAWRAIKQSPTLVSVFLENPQSELDLAARAKALRDSEPHIASALRADPEWCDYKLAAWWIWCQCASFSPDWLTQANPPITKPYRRGILSIESTPEQWLDALAKRLSKVSLCHGDWSRMVTDSALGLNNTGTFPTAVFFDPPYPDERLDYGAEGEVARDIEEWCRERGDDERLRIVLCGHVGDYDLPGWKTVNWGGSRGWGRGRRGDNEAMWLSPGCLPIEGKSQLSLLGAIDG